MLESLSVILNVICTPQVVQTPNLNVARKLGDALIIVLALYLLYIHNAVVTDDPVESCLNTASDWQPYFADWFETLCHARQKDGFCTIQAP